MNGISCIEACSSMADYNKFKKPRKDLLNDADHGDDDSGDEDGDCSEI